VLEQESELIASAGLNYLNQRKTNSLFFRRWPRDSYQRISAFLGATDDLPWPLRLPPPDLTKLAAFLGTAGLYPIALLGAGCRFAMVRLKMSHFSQRASGKKGILPVRPATICKSLSLGTLWDGLFEGPSSPRISNGVPECPPQHLKLVIACSRVSLAESLSSPVVSKR